MAGVTFDPLDPAYLQNPYPTWARLREEDPVPDVGGVRWVTRYETAESVLKDHERFSNKFLDADAVEEILFDDPEARRIIARRLKVPPTLIMVDPPEHSRHRTLVNRAFSGRRVVAREESIREVCLELLDAIPAGEAFDFVAAFAWALPMRVIAEILGVPTTDMETFKRWSDDALAALGPMDAGAQRRVAQSSVELYDYLASRIEWSRRKPGDDLLSGLVQAAEEGLAQLTTAEILSMVVQILIAGNETTTSLLGNGIRLLCEHPEELSMLRADPDLWPGAIEEMLRFESPFSGLFRVTTEDVVLDGVDVAAGTTLVVHFGAANRDPRHFVDPDRFDITRENAREHLAFGEGIHYCLGNQLARAEARIAFPLVVESFPDLALDSDRLPLWAPSPVSRGMKELWVRA